MLNLTPDKKLGGVLAPVSAVRGTNDLGIGDTEAMKELIAWAARNQLGAVQVLPINETGSDHSPYNIISSMAIEPSTIATLPGHLPELSDKAFKEITARHDLDMLRHGPVCYGEVKRLKNELLAAAYDAFLAKRRVKRKKEFEAFKEEHQDWLEDYTLYRALVNWHGGSEVMEAWPPEHREIGAARIWAEALSGDDKARFERYRSYHTWVQWVAFSQWLDVRKFAEKSGVALIGDIPVGVSIYSADVWADPEIFDLLRSSGAPPEKVFKSDLFTEKWGQNWGFPLYKWERMFRDNFAWWRQRLRAMMSIFHLLRIDHALGFFRIYSFPWRPERNATFTGLTQDEAKDLTGGLLPGFMERDDSTEDNRHHNNIQGKMLFGVFLEETGPHRIIAEDLGEVPPYVRPTLIEMEVPGFKIPQWERSREDNRMIPGKDYARLSLATFATHDHPPIRKFWEDWLAATQSDDQSAKETAIRDMREMLDFCGASDIPVPQPFTAEIHEAMLRGLYETNSWLAVHMITDILGTDDRFNVPGAVGSLNWTTRISKPVSEWDQTWAPALAASRKALEATDRAVFSQSGLRDGVVSA